MTSREIDLERAINSFNLGVCNFLSGDIELAKRYHEDALKTCPTERKVLLNLGVVYDHLEESEIAKYYYREGLKDGKKPLYCSLRLAELISLKSPKQALTFLDKIGPELEEHSQYHNLRGEILHTINEKDAARKSFQKALELDHTNQFSLMNLGLLYGGQQVYLLAINNLIGLVKKQPDSGLAHYNLAVALERSGRYESAIQEYEKVIELNNVTKGMHNSMKSRIEWLKTSNEELEKKYSKLEGWVTECCRGKTKVYLDEHPTDTKDKLSGLFEERIGFGELPFATRIAAIGHDLERAFDSRVRKQQFGLPEKDSLPTKEEWMSVYQRYTLVQDNGLSKEEWEGLYNEGKGLDNPQLAEIRDKVYILYKKEHSKNSAKIIHQKMSEDLWPQEIMDQVEYLILNHEIGSDEESDDGTVDFLRKADAASFFSVNIPIYVNNRSLESTLAKINLNVEDILEGEPTILELKAAESGIAYYLEVCNTNSQPELAKKARQMRFKVRNMIAEKRKDGNTIEIAAPPRKDFHAYEDSKFGFDPHDEIFGLIKTKIESPLLIITNGLTATGKSTTMSIAYDQLRKIFGEEKVKLYRSCDVREQLFGYDGSHKDPSYFNIFDKSEAAAEGTRQRYETIKWISEKAKEDIQNGIHVLVDSTFIERSKRELMYEVASDTGCEFYIIRCVCDNENEITNRIRKRMDRNKPKDEAASPEIYKLIKKAEEPLEYDDFPDNVTPKVVTFDTYKERLTYPGLSTEKLKRINWLFSHLGNTETIKRYTEIMDSQSI